MNHFPDSDNAQTRICNKAVTAYLQFLSGAFESASTEEGCLIIPPFQRSDGEYIELEMMPQIDGFRLTDNGDTIDYLWLNGLNTKRKGVRQSIEYICKGYNVKLSDGEIVTFSDAANLGVNLHNILCAVQDVSYLIYKREFRGKTTFGDEVEKILIANSVPYETNYEIKITQRVSYTFAFFINGKRNMLLEPLTATTANTAFNQVARLSNKWVEIRDYHPHYRKVAIIEDTGKKAEIWEPRSIDILERRSDEVLRWSQPQMLVDLLKSGHR